ncbi:MAG: dTMP kinase [Pseudomonadota bacterium]
MTASGDILHGPGVFITFEGGDGVGKTTQIALLRNRLEALGHAVVVSREPGGAPGAEEIRKLLVTGSTDRWSAKTEALLMNAARTDHLERTILPALATGKIVLCDRFADSTLAYQGIAGALTTEWVMALQSLVVGPHMPELTLVLQMGEAAALARATAREEDLKGNDDTAEANTAAETRFEEKGPTFQAQVTQAFTHIAEAAPERCVLIPADGTPETVAARIWQTVSTRLPALAKTAAAKGI